MKQKRARRFVVGYKSLSSFGWTTIYGRRHFLPRGHDDHRLADHCDPMTKADAQKAAKNMPCVGAVIYELTPVELPG